MYEHMFVSTVSHRQCTPKPPVRLLLSGSPSRRHHTYSCRVAKEFNEIRDPLQVFVEADPDELAVVDSSPFQRLRHIHQLATTYLIYPGATHRRFEHSLGVMELASRVYDVVVDQDHQDAVRRFLPILADRERLGYWRRVLRMAALCHDIGHLPFSHAAERELLPAGTDHEVMTK